MTSRLGGGGWAGKSINFFYSVGLTRSLCLSLSISVRSCRHCRHLSRLSWVSVSYSSVVIVGFCLFRHNCRSLSRPPLVSVSVSSVVIVGLCLVCGYCRFLSPPSSLSVSVSYVLIVGLCPFLSSLSVSVVSLFLCTHVLGHWGYSHDKGGFLGDIKLVFCSISLRNQADPTL